MSEHEKEQAQKINAAMDVANRFGTIDGDHHKMWVIDQMVQALMGAEYYGWVAERGSWERGIAP
jgi:hypothetical protein